MDPNDNLVMIENARLIFRNFEGKEGRYNQKGDRNFAVLIDEDVVSDFQKDGWNVKWLKPREEGDPEQAYLPVTVSYRIRPPRIIMITSRGRTPLRESEIELLDWADIKQADILLRPREWEPGRIKAYLQTMFITIAEDPLELKYAEYDDISTRSGKVQE